MRISLQDAITNQADTTGDFESRIKVNICEIYGNEFDQVFGYCFQSQ